MTTIKNQTTGRILVILKSTETHVMAARNKHGVGVQHIDKRDIAWVPTAGKEWLAVEAGQ